ncbi:hypothetical protein [Xanthomonas campestris]|uniref:hypothetical protein n=1 Tax=Xanthomonas campestris TaxID=339 RepID=UPI002367AE71|nr:hypothetical protein [Xanthomonas campestris]WDJ35697.1 hypothetical protein JH256_05270 [Xanthomonas campestris pv. campestris]WDJ82022.1 hypothetical protein JH309_05270 [Xanthomonas campestris pv. campestris]
MVDVVICKIDIPYEATGCIKAQSYFVVLNGDSPPKQIGNQYDDYASAFESRGGAYPIVSTQSIGDFFGECPVASPAGEAPVAEHKYESNSVIAFEPSIGAAVMEITVWEGGVGQSRRSEKQPAYRYMLAQLGGGILGAIKMFSSPESAKSALVAMKADIAMADVSINSSSHGMK